MNPPSRGRSAPAEDGSRPAQVATWVHYATLAVAAVVLLWLGRNMWFLLDEWAFIVDREVLGGEGTLGLLDPHNEHWSTVATLAYRGLFGLFGLHTYLPYLAMDVLAHLVAAHLLWRVLRRVAVDPWVATAGATTFLFLGVGWENITRAFQMTLVGSLAMGLLWLLVMPTTRRFSRLDLVGWVIGIVALTFSGVGVAMVAMAALYALLRRGWRMAIVVASVPAVVYVAWVAGYARSSFEHGGQPLDQGLRDLPGYVWAGLTGAVDLTTGLAGAGVVAILALAAWSVRRAGWPLEPRWALALAAAGGALFQLGFTAVRRSQLGLQTATDSRYVYLVVALLLPLTALAVSTVLAGRRRLAVVAVATAAILFVQLPILVDRSREWTAIVADGRGVFVAAVELARADDELVSSTPYPWFAPQVQVDELVELADDGDLPLEPEPTADQVLTARTNTQLRVAFLVGDDAPEPGPDEELPRVVASRAVTWEQAGQGCLRFLPVGAGPLIQLHPGGPYELALRPEVDDDVDLMYVEGEHAAVRPATFPVVGGHWLAVESAAEGPDLRLGLPEGVTTVCGLAGPGA